jgi:hypothetical protein
VAAESVDAEAERVTRRVDTLKDVPGLVLLLGRAEATGSNLDDALSGGSRSSVAARTQNMRMNASPMVAVQQSWLR